MCEPVICGIQGAHSVDLCMAPEGVAHSVDPCMAPEGGAHSVDPCMAPEGLEEGPLTSVRPSHVGRSVACRKISL